MVDKPKLLSTSLGVYFRGYYISYIYLQKRFFYTQVIWPNTVFLVSSHKTEIYMNVYRYLEKNDAFWLRKILDLETFGAVDMYLGRI
jgi:hypothetical protein